jgi:hypothetical protein
MNIE